MKHVIFLLVMLIASFANYTGIEFIGKNSENMRLILQLSNKFLLNNITIDDHRHERVFFASGWYKGDLCYYRFYKKKHAVLIDSKLDSVAFFWIRPSLLQSLMIKRPTD